MSTTKRVAVVTGAARGLGRAYAVALAEAGIDVVAADLEDAAETAREVESHGVRGLAVRCDIGSEEEVAALAERTESELGGCDILVNNAGFVARAGLEELTLEDWHLTMRVNLDGMLLTSRRFVPGMRERSWGRVINVTSTTVGLVMNGFLAYVTSKAGIIGFTRALASEVGPSGITVNAVMPGLTRTEGTRGEEESGFMAEMAARQPIPRIVETDDLADVVVFLASESSRMMTGQTLVVDGGVIRL
jgi:3-oxoacyl-[acyl-carrier protein] reductase/(S)-1-phenylethanol dehydrogenase